MKKLTIMDHNTPLCVTHKKINKNQIIKTHFIKLRNLV